jgi:putative tricarboxylic transport membrane protein
MTYVNASLTGLQSLLTLGTVAGLFAGIAWGLLISFMPGVGGNVALALLLPLMYRFSVPVALAILFGAHIATYFGGSVTSITLNIPASTKSLSLCWDGFPLASEGRGAYALRASASASGIGGVIGAVALTLGIPVMRGMLNYLGPPEILLLALFGATLIAILSSGNLTKGLMAFGAGVILSWVGQDPITGVYRLTFGSLYLASGIQVADVAIGLFAIAQAIRLMTEARSPQASTRRSLRERIAARGAAVQDREQEARQARKRADDRPLDGLVAVLKHWKLELYMAIFGVFTGTVPGFGAPVAAIAAYGQAAQFSRPEREFGTGAIEGVIAPQATDSAAEGGGMLPLLSLGIPTHEQQALLLAAFVTLGIAPGPTMLKSQLPTVFSIIWIIVAASLLMMIIGLLFARQFAKLTTIPVSILVPVILVISIVGSFALNGEIRDVITTFVFGIVGYFCWKYNYSRINLIIGLVLGPIIESNIHITTTLYGYSFIATRPLSAAIAACLVATLLAWAFQAVRRRLGKTGEDSDIPRSGARRLRLPDMDTLARNARSGHLVTAVVFLACFIAVAVISRGYGSLTGGDLGIVAGVGAVLALANVARVLMFGGGEDEGIGERLRRASKVTAKPMTPAMAPVPAAAVAAGGTVDAPAMDDSPAEAAHPNPVAAPATGRRSGRGIALALGIVVAFLMTALLIGIVASTGVAFGLYTKFIARGRLWVAVVAGAAVSVVTWALFQYIVNGYAVYGGIWHGL